MKSITVILDNHVDSQWVVDLKNFLEPLESVTQLDLCKHSAGKPYSLYLMDFETIEFIVQDN